MSLYPFLKWPGGKRGLLPHLRGLLGGTPHKRYFEPFIGGGALLFSLSPMNAPVINDANEELINAYQVIRDSPEELLESLNAHSNTEEYFYAIRGLDRAEGWREALGPVKRASRLLYLNHSCFNGLYRTNRNGHFNTPFGKYANPRYANPDNIRAVSGYLRESGAVIGCGDFEEAVSAAAAGDLVYFDPPYDPVSRTASFTAYTGNGFGRAEQERLKSVCDSLTAKGVLIVLSNSSTDYIRSLYKDYIVDTVQAARAIGASGGSRGRVDEVLIRNFNPTTGHM